MTKSTMLKFRVAKRKEEPEDEIDGGHASQLNWWSCLRCAAVNAGAHVVCVTCGSPSIVKPEPMEIRQMPNEPLHNEPVPSEPVLNQLVPNERVPKETVPPAVEEVRMFRARDGSLHEGRDLALHHNGIEALREFLERNNGKDSEFTTKQVLDNFRDWYLFYLENSKP